MMSDYLVFWRREYVGYLREATEDMWYVEGCFEPTPSQISADFVRRASELDAAAVRSDPALGIRAAIQASDEDEFLVTTIILSLRGDRLFLRRVFLPEAVEWVEDNVGE